MKVMATSPPLESLSTHIEERGRGEEIINKDIGLHRNNMRGNEALVLLGGDGGGGGGGGGGGDLSAS